MTETKIAPASGAGSDAGKPVLPLRQQLWRSYVRTALIPLIVIELGFLVAYWVSATVVYNENADAVSDLSRRYFQDIAHREAATISASLESVASHTRVFARQALTALEGDYIPPPSERARYAFSPEGAFYTTRDNGTTASIYSSRTRIGQEEIQKIWKLSALDPFMKSVVDNNTIISSVYLNTFDSYNRIYPYVDLINQVPHDSDISSYNFYYEANEENNPERRDVWTNAYVDPAGHGWMVSSIAPVWRGDKLEGVVGIDVKLETLIDSLLNMNLPWGGYAVLVDDSGSIIALPPRGEEDFGLTELTSHTYAHAIRQDILKPETFNIYQREDMQALAEAMRNAPEGTVELMLGGPRLASFDTVPQTDWKLVTIAPTDQIFADARDLNNRLETVAFAMLGSLFFFYLLFLVFLLRRSRAMSQLIAKPLTDISGLIDHLSERDVDTRFEGSEVEELDKLGHRLVATRQLLIEAENETRAQSRIASDALAQLRKANGEMINLTRLMSHQIRTPLSVIDGTAQIIQRKAETLTPDDLRKRAGRLRNTVATITELLSKLVNRFDAIALKVALEDSKGPIDIRGEVARLAGNAIPPERLRLSLPANQQAKVRGAGILGIVFQEVLAHALRHSIPDSIIEVSLEIDPSGAKIMVVSGESATSMQDRDLSRWHLAKDMPHAFSEMLNIDLHIARQALEEKGGFLTVDSAFGKVNVTFSIPLIPDLVI